MRKEGGRFYFARLSSAEKLELRDLLNQLHGRFGESVLHISEMLGRTQGSTWKLFERLEIPRRSLAEANQISAPSRTRTKRVPFMGSGLEKAYLLGFTSGDLTAWQISGTRIMVSSTTTHRAFVELFRQMFGSNSPIYQWTMFEEKKGYRWRVGTRLDNSFQFLLVGREEGLKWALSDRTLFMAWLAGFVESDGNIQISRSSDGVRMRVNLYNSNVDILYRLKAHLESLGFSPSGPYVTMPKGTITPYGTYTKDLWNLPLQRKWEVQELLRDLPLRHSEKCESKSIVLSIRKSARWQDVISLVRDARKRIKIDVAEFARMAEDEYLRRHTQGTEEQATP